MRQATAVKAGENRHTDLGNAKAMNVVNSRALVKAIGSLDDVDWDAQIEKNVP